MKIKIIFLFLWFGSAIYSQNIDNQLQTILSSTQPDSIKCKKLLEFIDNENDHKIWGAYNLQLINISKKNSEKTTNKTEKLKYLKYLAIGYQNRGAFANYSDQYTEAIAYYNKSLTITLANNFDETSSSNYQNIGTAYDFLGNLNLAIQNFNKALFYAKKSGSKEAIAYVLTDLGFAINQTGNSKKAIESNFEALKLFKEMGDDAGIERTSFAIGRIFDTQQEYSKSIAYYEDCLKISVKNKDVLRECLALNSLANAYILTNTYDKAYPYLQKSIEIAQKNNFNAILGAAYKHLGDYYFHKKKLTSAEQILEKAVEIFENGENSQQLAMVYIQLGKIARFKNEESKALKFLKQAYTLSKKSNYLNSKKISAELLSDFYLKNKDYQNSYLYLKEVNLLKDSLYHDENRNIALKTEFKYENELKQAQIKALSQQKQITELESKRKTNMIYSIIGMIAALMATVYFWFVRYKSNKEKQLLAIQLKETQERLLIEQKATQSELKALKSQMNPHFMFNALNSIQEQFMYGDKIKANEQMGNFTDLTRKILMNSGKKRISLDQEIDVLEKYLQLERIRFVDNFEYDIILSENIDKDYHQIPPMLIQPFVENSILHGLLPKQGLKKLTINFELDPTEAYIICTVIDNGIGRAQSALLKSNQFKTHQSFSTTATEERLRLINKSMNTNNAVVYEDLVDTHGNAIGTRVIITVSLS